MELSEEKINSVLNFDADIFVYDTVGSTNVIAEELAGKTQNPIIVVAEAQTDGRGRSGKSFYSPHSTGLYFTLVLHPDSDFYSMNTVTCGVSVAVTRAIEKLTGLNPKIKWVNDIYLDEKKVCGILCKAVGGNGKIKHLIIGIGINILTTDFPDELKSFAGSLNKSVDKNLLASEIANNIVNLHDNYMDEYRRKSCVIGKEIVYWKNGNSFNATAVDIDENGGLVVTDGKEKTTLTGGEITLRLK